MQISSGVTVNQKNFSNFTRSGWSRLRHSFDWPLALTWLGLNLFGILAMAGGEVQTTFWHKQLIFIGIGLVVMILFALFDYRIFKNYSTPVVDRKSTRLNSSHSSISYAVF